jgi:hypothetical protein
MAATKRRARTELIEEPVRARPSRTLAELVAELAACTTDAAAMRKTIDPILTAYLKARKIDPELWAFYCEWRGEQLRFTIYDAAGDEVDPRTIPIVGTSFKRASSDEE